MNMKLDSSPSATTAEEDSEKYGNREKAPAKAAHVNMMTDTIIANLPLAGFRTIMRGLLGADPQVTAKFNHLVVEYLTATCPATIPVLFIDGETTPAFLDWQQRYRCLMGCGMGFESMKSLLEVVQQLRSSTELRSRDCSEKLIDDLAIVDADIVQSVTAIQKELLTDVGARAMSDTESTIVQSLFDELVECEKQSHLSGQLFPFERGLSRIQKLEGTPKLVDPARSHKIQKESTAAPKHLIDSIEHFPLGSSLVPRIFMGLWQFSSPSWGTAPRSKINRDLQKHVDAGFTAYDMADHYGDAEVTFGQFMSAQPDATNIFCATKYCIFESITITEESVKANITERLMNINTDAVDLLQLHWQSYEDPQYVRMAQLVEQDPRVSNVGLCNFDTQRMDEIVEAGVRIVSNQVQFSLIDLRPRFKMAENCRKHSIKLLTYGTLCGGFLADQWLDKPSPDIFGDGMTPSHRKYFEMITVWGGWNLLQDLLSTLSLIGRKYDVSISNVATRWVLDHDYVGAVIIGGRMGISEHVEENLKIFSFKLDQDDQAAIKSILDKSRSVEVFEAMGDCGAEYRH